MLHVGRPVSQPLLVWAQQQGFSDMLHHFGGPQFFALSAFALFASPKHASAIPARPTPNFLNACRRVTDWAICLVSSSNLLFMFFLSFVLFVSVFTADIRTPRMTQSHAPPVALSSSSGSHAPL